MKAKIKYSEETGIQKMIRMKKDMKRMKEMDEAMMEARAMSSMNHSCSCDMPKMQFGRKRG